MWHFEPHSLKNNHKFTKFFHDAGSRGRLYFLGDEKDYSTGTPLSRKYSFGKNSWMQWSVFFSAPISSSSLEIQVTREPGKPTSKTTMDHKLTIVNRKNPGKQITLLFSTPPSPKSKIVDRYVFDEKTPIELPAGEYDIRLTELKDSDPNLEDSERIIKILLLNKIEKEFY